MYVYQRFREQVADSLSRAMGLKREEIEPSLDAPKDPSHGDLTTNICFRSFRSSVMGIIQSNENRKKSGKKPQDFANEIAGKIKSSGLIESVQALNGYLNFRAKKDELYRTVLGEVQGLKDKYGTWDIGKGEKVIVEHTATNPNKALHIGHARNAVLGDTITRLYRALGYNVEVENYIDDTGPQVADTAVGFLYLKAKEDKRKFDHFCGDLYVKVNDKYEADSVLTEKRIEVIHSVEKGGNKIADFVKDMAMRVLKEQLKSAWRMNIFYDLLTWESDIIHLGFWDTTFEKLKKTGEVYLEEGGPNKGCWVIKLSELEEFKNMESPDKILVRSDGTLTYTAKDIAYHFWKFGILGKDFKYKKFIVQPDGSVLMTTSITGSVGKFGRADRVINVIDTRQSYPQKIVKYSLKLLGFEKQYEKFTHFGYEVVSLASEDEKIRHMSGRKGIFVNLDDVLDRAEEKAYEEVNKRNPEESEKFKRETAKIVGCGAVRYGLLKIEPDKLIQFSINEALDFNGDTAPYLQYTHARACSILRKAGKYESNFDSGKLIEPVTESIIKKLMMYPMVVREASRLKPNVLASFTFGLAEQFNSFYNSLPVLRADRGVREARLAIVNSVRLVLSNALNLLGITAPERM